MSVQIPIDLRVLGHSFRLATTEEKREDLVNIYKTAKKLKFWKNEKDLKTKNS